MKDELRRMKDFFLNLQPSAFNLEFGFTLLEVMISLAIVGGLLVTLLYTLNYHLGIAERHRTVTISTELAKGKMYDMEKAPAVGKGTFPEPYSDYSYETGIRASLIPDMSEMWVVVKSGKESITLGELITKAK
jgi:general secretion pathway protein I